MGVARTRMGQLVLGLALAAFVGSAAAKPRDGGQSNMGNWPKELTCVHCGTSHWCGRHIAARSDAKGKAPGRGGATEKRKRDSQIRGDSEGWTWESCVCGGTTYPCALDPERALVLDT